MSQNPNQWLDMLSGKHNQFAAGKQTGQNDNLSMVQQDLDKLPGLIKQLEEERAGLRNQIGSSIQDTKYTSCNMSGNDINYLDNSVNRALKSLVHVEKLESDLINVSKKVLNQLSEERRKLDLRADIYPVETIGQPGAGGGQISNGDLDKKFELINNRIHEVQEEQRNLFEVLNDHQEQLIIELFRQYKNDMDKSSEAQERVVDEIRSNIIKLREERPGMGSAGLAKRSKSADEGQGEDEKSELANMFQSLEDKILKGRDSEAENSEVDLKQEFKLMRSYMKTTVWILLINFMFLVIWVLGIFG